MVRLPREKTEFFSEVASLVWSWLFSLVRASRSCAGTAIRLMQSEHGTVDVASIRQEGDHTSQSSSVYILEPRPRQRKLTLVLSGGHRSPIVSLIMTDVDRLIGNGPKSTKEDNTCAGPGIQLWPASHFGSSPRTADKQRLHLVCRESSTISNDSTLCLIVALPQQTRQT